MFLSSEKNIKTSQLYSLTNSFLNRRMNIFLCQRKAVVFAIKKSIIKENAFELHKTKLVLNLPWFLKFLLYILSKKR